MISNFTHVNFKKLGMRIWSAPNYFLCVASRAVVTIHIGKSTDFSLMVSFVFCIKSTAGNWKLEADRSYFLYVSCYTVSVCYSFSFRKEQWNKKLIPLKKNWHLLSQTLFIHNCKQATNLRVPEQARLPCDTRCSKPHLQRLLPLILLTEWPVDLYWLCIAPL